MELDGVDDFEHVVSRYDECFEKENHDRPVLFVTAPKGKKAKTPPAPSTLHDRWFDFEWRLDCFTATIENTYFTAEGFPHFHCNLGPDLLTACLGSRLEFAEDTSWAVPRVKDWSDEPPLRFNPDNPYWQAMERFLKLSAERGKGRWITDTGDLHSNGDALSALRGPANLCFDLIERPHEVRKRLGECMAVWKEIVTRHHDIIQPRTGDIVSSWLSAAVRGRFAAVQNDFSFMISEQMFREFFQQILRDEAACLDRAIYHLDGPGAIRHLDALCEIEEIDAIQWVPGAGQPPMSDWIPLLKRIQDKGKGLHIGCAPHEVRLIVESLRPEGVIICTVTESPEDADALVNEVSSLHERQ